MSTARPVIIEVFAVGSDYRNAGELHRFTDTHAARTFATEKIAAGESYRIYSPVWSWPEES